MTGNLGDPHAEAVQAASQEGGNSTENDATTSRITAEDAPSHRIGPLQIATTILNNN